jgi:hypothetical protein
MSDEDLSSAPSKRPEVGRRSSAVELVKPGEADFWHEEDGSLRFISRIVRYPCAHIWGVLTVALLMTMIAGQSFETFDSGEHDYDLDSIQAVKFDSLNLASKMFETQPTGRRQLSNPDFNLADPRVHSYFGPSNAASILAQHLQTALGPANLGQFPHRDSFERVLGEHQVHSRELTGDEIEVKVGEGDGSKVDQQSQSAAPLLMAYEHGDTLFSPETLAKIKATEDIFRKNTKYGQFCKKTYEEPGDPANNCTRPFSAINLFYASEWDRAAVERVKSNLTTTAEFATFNTVALCFAIDGAEEFPYCQRKRAGMAESSWDLQKAIGSDLNAITDAWDGQAEVVANGNTQAGIDEMLQFVLLCKKLPLYGYKVDYYFDKDFSATNLKSRYTRSVGFFGTPLEGYVDENDREDEQKKKLATWFKDECYADLLAAGDGELKVLLLFIAIIFEVIFDTIIADMMLSFAAILMVWSFLWLQTGSCFIATMGMVEIMLSLPCAYFFYRCIFQIKFFGWTNAMALFLVLAIGADDVFVFMDAYKQSAKAGPAVLKNLSTRMTWVYKRAGLAMLITSATTCAAFLCTCLSPLASQISFGIFAALVIFCDYILVMSFFCTTVIIYHNAVEYRSTCGCETKRTGCCACVCCFPIPIDERSTTLHRDDDLSKVENEHQDETVMENLKAFKFSNALALLFGRKLAEVVLKKEVRVAILVVCIAWGIPMIVLASKIQPTTQAEQFLPDSHPFQAIINVLNNAFPKASQEPNMEVFVSWGVGMVDRDGVDQMLDANFVGKATMDAGFVFDEATQAHIVDACVAVGAGIDHKAAEFHELVGFHSDTGFGAVDCWVHDLKTYVEVGNRSLSSNFTIPGSPFKQSEYRFPIPVDQVPAVMEEFMATTVEGGFGTVLDKYSWQLGWDPVRRLVRFVSIKLGSCCITEHAYLTRDRGLVEYNKFEQYVDRMNERGTAAGVPGAGCFQTDAAGGGGGSDIGKWNFINNQKIYQDSASAGAKVGVCLAFVVILMATRSLIVAVAATTSIACTLLCVLGGMQMLGWQLGTIEAILISITAGFSVDYVVHLAHAYVQKTNVPRAGRVTEAFEEMGVSVFSGMATSFMAAFVLLFCQLRFFYKFGVFLAMTITFSWLWANFFFMGAMATFGPESKTHPTEASDNDGANPEKEVGVKGDRTII